MTNDLPYISVVIPNLNQSDRLAKTLEAFAAQSYPADRIEIIVVDNGSTDGSQEVAKKYDCRLMIYDIRKNPYVCRNIGIRMARYPWIALTDSSCIPNGIYLHEMMKVQQELKADLVVGEREFEVSKDSTLGEIVDSLYFMRNHEYFDTRTVFPTGTMLFRKSLVDEIGFFREDMRSGPDFIWTDKAKRAGNCIAYAANAKVSYAGSSFPRLFRKAHRDGWGHGTMARENGTFNWLDGVWRLRPPSPKYVRYVFANRGKPGYRSRLIGIWFGLWAYRIVFNLGRMHVGKSWFKSSTF